MRCPRPTLFALLALVLASPPLEALRPANPRCEYRPHPLGIEDMHPRLSWVVKSESPDARGERQTAYRVLVARSRQKLDPEQADLWDSGWVESDRTVHVCYAGEPLTSAVRCWWKVRVRDQDGAVSGWSEPARWEMGLLQQSDWSGAQWIADPRTADAPGSAHPAPLMRRAFESRGEVSRARLYVCGLGFYEAFLNDAKIGGRVLNPAQTNYEHYAFYDTYDVTDRIRGGKNALGILLGNGWYNQTVAWGGMSYGTPGAICRLRIDYEDGTQENVVTDGSWQVTDGPIRQDNLYVGEVYDARLEVPGWCSPGFDAQGWRQAAVVEPRTPELRATPIEPIRRIKTIEPVDVTNPEPGVWIYDVGQNFAGWARLKIRAPEGTRVQLRFGEELEPDGTLNVGTTLAPLKRPPQKDVYVCAGDGLETWEPRFTYHGFRHVEVTGYPGKPPPDLLTGVVVHTDVRRAGRFRCSNSLINRIHRTALWTQRSNLHSIPTDCPHREKCGWLGDAHAAAEMTIYNFDMARFWTKFMGDVETSLGQARGTATGAPPSPGVPCNIAPGKRHCLQARPDWGYAIIALPWHMYRYYGDTDVMAHHYDHMKRWMEYLDAEMTEGHIVQDGFGDWCPPGGNEKMACPVKLSSTALYYSSARIMQRVAKTLYRPRDTRQFGRLAGNIRSAFIEEFYDAENRTFGSQTADALALRFGLAPEGREQAVADSLARNVREQHDGNFNTGILGHRYLYDALARRGHDEVARGILTQRDFPSFAELFDRGATTFWEVWLPRGAERNAVRSHNHPMHGGFDAWFYAGVGGIRPVTEAPGFKEIVLRPGLTSQLDRVRTRYRSVHGLVTSCWENQHGAFRWDVSIPANTSATIYVPAAAADGVTESGRPAAEADCVEFLRIEGRFAVFRVGSGRYRFRSPRPPEGE